MAESEGSMRMLAVFDAIVVVEVAVLTVVRDPLDTSTLVELSTPQVMFRDKIFGTTCTGCILSQGARWCEC